MGYYEKLNKLIEGKKHEEATKILDKEWEKLEKQEQELENKEKPKRKIIDQTQDAIDTIRECVNDVLKIDDLKTDQELFNSRMLTIISWFDYLKEKKSETKEYEEAKELIMSIGKKHTKLYNWCKEFVEKPIPEYEDSTLKKVELNVSKNNEYEVKEGVKVVFDYEEVKKYADEKEKAKSIGTLLKFGELNYKVVCADKEYKFRNYIENYNPKQEYDKDCPYRVYAPIVKKDTNGDYIVTFDIMSWMIFDKENNSNY